MNAKKSDLYSKLVANIITAAEQQTMNYYMNVSTFQTDDLSRRLYQEIALVEEEHVTEYGSLIDPNGRWLEMALWHEYTECYLYWSCYKTETHPYIRALWEQNLQMEIAHLHKAAELLKKYEGKEWQEVIPDGTFPEPLRLHENIEYVRDILGTTAQYTSVLEDYENVDKLPENATFFKYQEQINPSVCIVPSHQVIDTHIRHCGKDYRYQVAESPVKALRPRACDNTTVGREKGAAKSTGFTCN